MKKSYNLLVLLFVVNFSYSQNLAGYEQIVNYKFLSDGSDSLGNYSDATVLNALYQQGGVYSNGIYSGNDTTGSYIRTPNITGLDLEKFAIKLDFKADSVGNDILVCGYYWRWLTVYTRPDSTLEMYANKNDLSGQVITNSFKVVPGTWYSLGVVFDSLAYDITIYIDNNYFGTFPLLTHFNHQNDFTFSNENGGTAVTYKGHWKNLQIYNQCTSSPVAGFSSNKNGLTVNFTDTTSGSATNYIWDFGDGNTSTQQNPQHTYVSPGSYTVCLIASGTCGGDTICNLVSITATGINDNEEIGGYDIYPNPSNGIFSISTKEDGKNRTYEIYSISGQMIKEGKLTDFKKEINISNVPQGLYFLKISSDKYNATYKLIIN